MSAQYYYSALFGDDVDTPTPTIVGLLPRTGQANLAARFPELIVDGDRLLEAVYPLSYWRLPKEKAIALFRDLGLIQKPMILTSRLELADVVVLPLTVDGYHIIASTDADQTPFSLESWWLQAQKQSRQTRLLRVANPLEHISSCFKEVASLTSC